MIPSLTLLAAQSTAFNFRLARLASLDQWWHWLVLAAACLAIVGYVVWMYRRDTVELPRSLTITLALLRLAAFFGILVFFLQLEKRADRQVTKTSRAIVLVDTSQSMGLTDPTEQASGATTSRLDQAVAEFSQGKLLGELRAKHDVVVYRFDQNEKPTELATFAKFVNEASHATPQEAAVDQYLLATKEAQLLAIIAASILGVSVLAGLIHWIGRRPRAAAQTESWSLLVSMVALIVAIVVLAVANLRHLDVPWQVLAGLRAPQADDLRQPVVESENSTAVAAAPTIDWQTELLPRGVETRLGDALRYLVGKERGGPISGIVVITDGAQNAGIETNVAVAEAQDAAIPIYAIGMGTDKLPQNVRLVDIDLPQRVYPGDEFNLTAFVQGSGLKDAEVELRLFSGPAEAGTEGLVEDVAQQRVIRLGDDSEVTPVLFKLRPSVQGRYEYQVRASTKAKDHDARDNQRSVAIEVVGRKNKVLLMAGGPLREFRFLRNQLHRDRDTLVDVYLQTGQPEVSQEANKLLFEFPKSEAELFEYDCIVAFDPDWSALDDKQVELLERWVAEKAGGLVVVAGPVHTTQWAGKRRGIPRYDTIRSLYPVVFYTTGSAALNLGRTGGEKAWPLQFTRDGEEAEFLWLTDDLVTSEDAWKSFGGVYGYFAVKDPKPGAKVFARFADPDTSIDNELPIYLAGHFYGAGRVFFQASGEMWRVRSVDEAYFEAYYTKLLRWVSQGRLMQDSTRGVLLVDKDRTLLGEQVLVRAMLTDAQRQPLSDPEVTLSLIAPDASRKNLQLQLVKDAPRPGTYAGQFTTTQIGDYRLELRIPHTTTNELLTRQVRVDAPKREIERPQRNDALLREITSKTDGKYYVGLPAAVSGAGEAPLANWLEPQDQTTVIPGTPDRVFDRRLMTWLLGLITGVLCLEWLLRRLNRLA